jgi:Carbon starvation protein, predicted membrane protein
MAGCLFFCACVALLIGGYFSYGKLMAANFQPDENRPTPAQTEYDGVDFVAMPTWKVVLIQFLNISALGPVFGPLLGALYGPVSLLWIVFGCIFAGAVHDYYSGMLSIRYKGKSVPEIVNANMGDLASQFMIYLSIVVLVLIGVVFVTVPAGFLASVSGKPNILWVYAILAYYFLATVTPIHTFIGRIYPVCMVIILIMTVSLPVMLFFKGYAVLPNLDFTTNTHISLPVWPMLFITIACGAISGFHSTQSPMMARCIGNEKMGRRVFYGSMIAEGVLALVWATIGLSFYEDAEGLRRALGPAGNTALVVREVSNTLLGSGLGAVSIIAVALLAITSGDTAFRSARLTIADRFNFSQKTMKSRLLIAIPLLLAGVVLSHINFGIIWRYFGWANQTLAMVMLWTTAVYLAQRGKCHWFCSIPAMFMTAATTTYLCFDKIGLGLSYWLAVAIGIVITAACFAFFLSKNRTPSSTPLDE